MNKTILNKGMKFIFWSVPNFFIGPAVIHFAYINPLQPTYYLISGFGIAISLAATVLLFLGLKIIMKSLFND